MERSKTERGFTQISFKDFYNKGCSIQESSIATEDCIWLGINDAEPLVMASEAASLGIETTQTTGWVKYPVPRNVVLHTRMHLSIAQVKELLPILQKFVDTGEI